MTEQIAGKITEEFIDKRLSIFRKIGFTISILLTLFVIYIGVNNKQNADIFLEKGISTQASVTKLLVERQVNDQGESAKIYKVVYTYKDQLNGIHDSDYSSDKNEFDALSVGSSLEIRYLPENPADHMRKDSIEFATSISGIVKRSLIVGGLALLLFEVIRFISGISLRCKRNQSDSVQAELAANEADPATDPRLSEQAMNLAMEAVDYAAENIQLTEDTFTSFALLLMKDGGTALRRFASDDPEIVNKMAQSQIEKEGSEILAYAIAQDGYMTFDNVKRDSIIVEAGCMESGRGINLAQQYENDSEYKEIDNVKLVSLAEIRIQAAG